MKKIFLVLILIISNYALAQSGYYARLKVRDSLYAPTRINAGAYYLNGVLQTFGGSGTFDTTAFHHFTGINIFSNGTYFQDSVYITGKFIAKGTEVDSLVATYLRSGTVPMARLSDSVFKLSNLDTSNLSQLNQINTFTNLNYFNRNTFIDTVKSYDGLFAQNLVLTTSGASDTIVAVRKFSFYDIASFYIAPLIKSLWDFPFGITTTTIVASALGTFNAGLTTTTLTASGNASFDGYNIYGDSTGGISLKFCLVKGKTGANTNSSDTFSLPANLRGNGFKRIVSWQCNMRNDSAVTGQRKNISPQSYFSNFLYYATIDSAVCRIVLPATSNLINDSAFFSIWYRSNGTAGN